MCLEKLTRHSLIVRGSRGTSAGAAGRGSRWLEGLRRVYRTPTGGDRLRGTVTATLDAREDERFPSELLVIEYDEIGGLIALDSALQDSSREHPVVAWDPGSAARGGPERLADDFGSYALHRCQVGLRRACPEGTRDDGAHRPGPCAKGALTVLLGF